MQIYSILSCLANNRVVLLLISDDSLSLIMFTYKNIWRKDKFFVVDSYDNVFSISAWNTLLNQLLVKLI